MTGDPRVTEFLGVPPRTRDEAVVAAERLGERLTSAGYGWWVVEVKGKVDFAGTLILQDVPFEAHFTPALEVGWHLAPDHWGNGYATEGGRALLEFAFAQLDRPEVVALTAKRNVRSQRVMERLGMTRNPADDFIHPNFPDSPLRECVLYRIQRPLARA
jgi:RimJ/RimL family protein N-acetyltransferase